MNTGMQKAGAVAALIASFSFLFGLALAATMLAPMVVPDLAFADYVALHQANGGLIYVWHLILYIIFGLSLVVMVTAFHDRLKESAPVLSSIAQAIGLIYAGFVILSGLLTIHGDEAILALATRAPAEADALRTILATITLSVDSSDRLLGCLWIGLTSVAGLRTRAIPRSLAILGIVVGLPGIVGLAFPSLLALSYVFALGIMVWAAWLGLWILLRRKK